MVDVIKSAKHYVYIENQVNFNLNIYWTKISTFSKLF